MRKITGRRSTPQLETHDVSQAGTLTGLTGFDQGIGLEVQLYGVSRIERDWHIPGDDTGIIFSGGGNAFYRLTPALTGTLTYNPDFSDAPLDARQVNTTRFSLFFPETRDFFCKTPALSNLVVGDLPVAATRVPLIMEGRSSPAISDWSTDNR